MDEKTASTVLAYYNDCKAVETYIKQHYHRQVGSRLRRGVVTKDIFDALGLNASPDNYKKVQKVMAEMNVRRIKVDSKAYFGELARKDN